MEYLTESITDLYADWFLNHFCARQTPLTFLLQGCVAARLVSPSRITELSVSMTLKESPKKESFNFIHLNRYAFKQRTLV